MPINVLLVEDSPGDVRLTQQEVFRASANPLDSLARCSRRSRGDGVPAASEDPCSIAAPGSLILLLDLNLPKMDGREVLAHIKEDDSLKTIPTVILTTSDAEVDIARAINYKPIATSASPCNWMPLRVW